MRLQIVRPLDDADDLASVDGSNQDGTLPPDVEKAVLKRASGANWKTVAAHVGVSTSTIHRWRIEHNMDARVRQVLRDTTTEGMQILAARFKAAARVVARHVDGDIEAEVSEDGSKSYAKAQLRYQAAKEAIGRVMRAWEHSTQMDGAVNGARALPSPQEFSPLQVIEAARAANAILKRKP